MRAWLIGCALLAAVAFVAYERPWEPSMGAEAAARELKADYVKGAKSVTCHRGGGDGSIPIDDVDYRCDVDFAHTSATWWVDSDRHHITETTSDGG